MPPVKRLLEKYVKNPEKWVDPFAGKHSPAYFSNDMNEERNARYCLDAYDFAKKMKKEKRIFGGCLFDPPYSYRQISEHYKLVGRKASAIDTSYNFYTRVMNELNECLVKDSIVISFGWNTQGFCKKRGFEKIEIMILAHGGHHNDTLVTVERKK